jgi:ubiquinone/menaquinone biosynthesis C-methylase UbiE
MSQQDEDVIKKWSTSAPYWEKHRDVIRGMFAPITQALLQDAQVAPGNTVLDVATGQGEPALSIAAAVGPAGKVYGIDPVPGMVTASQREAERAGVKNAAFETAGAEKLPFPADTFDAVVCRFGVPFFASPVDGIREMLRVLKPERMMALAVWHFVDRNPFHYELARVVDRYIAPTPVPPDTPDAFRFAARGKLAGMLAESVATGAGERLLKFSITVPGSAEDFWKLRCDMSDKFREKVQSLPEKERDQLRAETIEAYHRYSSGRGLSMPAEVLIVTGRKGASRA